MGYAALKRRSSTVGAGIRVACDESMRPDTLRPLDSRGRAAPTRAGSFGFARGRLRAAVPA